MASLWRLWPRRRGIGPPPAPPATEPRPAPAERKITLVRFDDSEWEIVAAVGESFYQPALCNICGTARWEEVRYECEAVLMPEVDNPYDDQAVAVYVEGEKVAHLPRGHARDYRPALEHLVRLDALLRCDAMICGRGPGSETQNLGIFLHIPSADDTMDEALEYEP